MISWLFSSLLLERTTCLYLIYRVDESEPLCMLSSQSSPSFSYGFPSYDTLVLFAFRLIMHLERLNLGERSFC